MSFLNAHVSSMARHQNARSRSSIQAPKSRAASNDAAETFFEF